MEVSVQQQRPKGRTQEGKSNTKDKKTNIQEVDAVLEAMEPAAVEAAEAEGFGSEARKKGSKRQRTIREKVTAGAVHAVMEAAILAGVRWGLELPVLIGLGIYHTGASAVAWDRAKR